MLHTVLLVDDQPEMLAAADLALRQHSRFHVIGCATNGQEALARLAELHPSVVVLDVQMPGLNGFQTARRLLAAQPDLRIILTSAADDPQYGALALQAGAVGFLHKRAMDGTAIARLLESAPAVAPLT